MFIRVTRQKNRKGETVEYAALAESYRSPDAKHPKTTIIKNFGRVNQKSLRSLRKLQRNLNEFLEKYD